MEVLCSQEMESYQTPPKLLLSLPTETLLDIIEYLPYLDRHQLKRLGSHRLTAVLRLCRRPNFEDYLNRYEKLDGIIAREGARGTFMLSCAKGHYAVALNILKQEHRNAAVPRATDGSTYSRTLIHSGIEQAVINTELSTFMLLLDLATERENIPEGMKEWYRYHLNYTIALECAAVNGHKGIIQLLLDHGATVQFFPDRPDAISLAARHGHESSVKLLLTQIGEISKDKLSPVLFEAAANGHLSIVNHLLDLGIKTLPKPSGLTALHVAAKGGHYDCFKAIYDRGAKDSVITCHDHVSHVYYEKWSALHFAVVNGHCDIVNYLIKKDHLLKLPVESIQTLVPLAAMKGEFSILELLLGKSLTVCGTFNGDTALHHAVMGDHLNIISLLLKNGADDRMMHGGKEMRSPLQKAAFTGSVRAASLLLACDPDINAQDNHGDTSLHTAVLRGNTLITELILKAGANPGIFNKVNDSAIDIAFKHDQNECLSLLLDYNPNHTPSNAISSNLLHEACTSGKSATIALLLSHGADIEAQDSLGRRPLHLIAYHRPHGWEGCLLHLLAGNADRDARCAKGRTALHYAAEYGYSWKDERQLNMDIIRLLMDWGLEMNAEDADGMTPLGIYLDSTKSIHYSDRDERIVSLLKGEPWEDIVSREGVRRFPSEQDIHKADVARTDQTLEGGILAGYTFYHSSNRAMMSRASI